MEFGGWREAEVRILLSPTVLPSVKPEVRVAKATGYLQVLFSIFVL